MNKNTNFNYINLSPFKWFVLENFPYIEADFDALTNWQLFCKLGKEMNKIIEKVNLTGQQTEDLTKAFNELKNYVDNYFKNLDVQEEINNKLDEMAESGELKEIIAQYLQLAGLLCFNTKQDMKKAENLIDGSFAKTFGNLVYNDGYGNFYKIREIQNTDVVDDDNIIALTNYNNLIAELIPDMKIININRNIEEIKKTNKPFNVNLENLLFYDTNRNKYTQGSCVDNNNRLYIYEETNFPYGDLLIFDIESLTYINKISNLKLYHGNDMCYLDGKIYVASCKADDGTLTNTKIVEYDISTGTLTEINPFSNTSYTDLFGIAVYDENNILCLLNKSTELFKNLGLYLYNINNGSIKEINITNTKNIQTNYWSAFQSMEYNNGNIYIITSISNTILNLKIDSSEENANLETIYNLPNVDNLGQVIGEYEGICKIPSNLYGNNTFLIYSNVIMFEANLHTIQAYLVNFENNTPIYLKINVQDLNINSNRRNVIKVNNTSTSLYENGSAEYPFKTLTRAMLFINCSKYKELYNHAVDIVGGNNYLLGCFSNKKIGFVNRTNNDITINLIGLPAEKIIFYNNDEINFIGYTNKRFILNIPTGINIDNCKFQAQYTHFNYTGNSIRDSMILLIGGANNINIVDSSANCNSKCTYVIRTHNNDISFLGFNEVSNVLSDYYYRCNGFSVSYIPYGQASKYTDTGSEWAIVIVAGARINV